MIRKAHFILEKRLYLQVALRFGHLHVRINSFFPIEFVHVADQCACSPVAKDRTFFAYCDQTVT